MQQMTLWSAPSNTATSFCNSSIFFNQSFSCILAAPPSTEKFHAIANAYRDLITDAIAGWDLFLQKKNTFIEKISNDASDWQVEYVKIIRLNNHLRNIHAKILIESQITLDNQRSSLLDKAEAEKYKTAAEKRIRSFNRYTRQIEQIVAEKIKATANNIYLAPIATAIQVGDLTKIKKLVAEGFDLASPVQWIDKKVVSTLWLASQFNQSLVVSYLLDNPHIKHSMDDIFAGVKQAVLNKNLEITTIFLKFNPSLTILVDPQDEDTLLHKAIFKNDINMTKLLLAYGADPSAKTAIGDTASDVAKKLRHIEIFNFLKKIAKNSSAVQWKYLFDIQNSKKHVVTAAQLSESNESILYTSEFVSFAAIGSSIIFVIFLFTLWFFNFFSWTKSLFFKGNQNKDLKDQQKGKIKIILDPARAKNVSLNTRGQSKNSASSSSKELHTHFAVPQDCIDISTQTEEQLQQIIIRSSDLIKSHCKRIKKAQHILKAIVNEKKKTVLERKAHSLITSQKNLNEEIARVEILLKKLKPVSNQDETSTKAFMKACQLPINSLVKAEKSFQHALQAFNSEKEIEHSPLTKKKIQREITYKKTPRSQTKKRCRTKDLKRNANFPVSSLATGNPLKPSNFFTFMTTPENSQQKNEDQDTIAKTIITTQKDIAASKCLESTSEDLGLQGTNQNSISPILHIKEAQLKMTLPLQKARSEIEYKMIINFYVDKLNEKLSHLTSFNLTKPLIRSIIHQSLYYDLLRLFEILQQQLRSQIDMDQQNLKFIKLNNFRNMLAHLAEKTKMIDIIQFVNTFLINTKHEQEKELETEIENIIIDNIEQSNLFRILASHWNYRKKNPISVAESLTQLQKLYKNILRMCDNVIDDKDGIIYKILFDAKKMLLARIGNNLRDIYKSDPNFWDKIFKPFVQYYNMEWNMSGKFISLRRKVHHEFKLILIPGEDASSSSHYVEDVNLEEVVFLLQSIEKLQGIIFLLQQLWIQKLEGNNILYTTPNAQHAFFAPPLLFQPNAVLPCDYSTGQLQVEDSYQISLNVHNENAPCQLN